MSLYLASFLSVSTMAAIQVFWSGASVVAERMAISPL
jgi:hypothetical protein